MIIKMGLKDYRFIFFFIGLLGLLMGCGEEEPKGADAPEINQFNVIDAGNQHNAADLFFRIRFAPGEVQKVRFLIVPAAIDGNMQLADTENLGTDAFVEYPIAANGFLDGQFSDALRDIDGAKLELNQAYAVRMVAFQGTDAFLIEEKVAITLSNKNPLIGKYVGLWNDAIYTDFGVSIEITGGSDNTASGVLYYSAGFTPCCSNPANDGTISFDFDSETQEIKNFTYNQRLANYLGGECNATYRGDGEIRGLQLLLNFTGSDCDGDHGNGLIDLNRKWD